jgi:hypothetical protein
MLKILKKYISNARKSEYEFHKATLKAWEYLFACFEEVILDLPKTLKINQKEISVVTKVTTTLQHIVENGKGLLESSRDAKEKENMRERKKLHD